MSVIIVLIYFLSKNTIHITQITNKNSLIGILSFLEIYISPKIESENTNNNNRINQTELNINFFTVNFLIR